MKKMMAALATAAFAAMPAAALQQQGQAPRAPDTHTIAGELVLYEMTNFNGDSLTVDTPRATVHTDWNIRSIAVHPGDRWQICARPRFQDPCIVLDRSVGDAKLIGIEGQIGSARQAPAAAPPAPAH
jgi:hypothetical protein